MNSYYDLLGVAPHATELEIRSAYGRDVLRLQDTTSDKVAQFRAALDAAFATLVDPDKRTAYDAALAVSQKEDAADSSDESDAAFGYALRGGLWFAGGGVLTAATYAFSQGRYLIAWGPLLFGGFQLVRGLLRYLTVTRCLRPGHRRVPQPRSTAAGARTSLRPTASRTASRRSKGRPPSTTPG